MTTAEERILKIKEQDRIRAKRYYDKHKETILKKRLENVETCKEAKNKICNCETTTTKTKAKETNNNNNILLNLESLKPIIIENVEKITSRTFYFNAIKTLGDILGCIDFNKCLKNSKNIIYKIETAAQKKDPLKTYSINTKKGLYQTILKLKDIIPLKLSANAIKQYTEKFEEHATESHEQTKERIQKDEVLNFDEYLNKVKEHFGEISKEFLISSLYHLSGFRDDLILKIVDKQPKETDENFLIMPPKATANCSILLNNYKTADKYGQQKISIDRVLSKIIREYINNKGLIYNNYLFGNKKLSSFIKKFNDKMGLKVSINNLRQMRVSEILNNNPSILDRVKLSHEMNHKATTSEKYQRKIK